MNNYIFASLIILLLITIVGFLLIIEILVLVKRKKEKNYMLFKRNKSSGRVNKTYKNIHLLTDKNISKLSDEDIDVLLQNSNEQYLEFEDINESTDELFIEDITDTFINENYFIVQESIVIVHSHIAI